MVLRESVFNSSLSGTISPVSDASAVSVGSGVRFSVRAAKKSDSKYYSQCDEQEFLHYYTSWILLVSDIETGSEELYYQEKLYDTFCRVTLQKFRPSCQTL